jgi:(p)ppGpp synthase/HD superfamily hydrolase
MEFYEVVLRVETDKGWSPQRVEDVLYASLRDSLTVGVAEVKRTYLALEEVDGLAQVIHSGQVDKIGVPYIEHVRAVSDALSGYGEQLQIAGLLHDAIEDGDGWTAERLLEAGVNPIAVKFVEAVTNVPGEKYSDKMERIAENREATLLKIADNAHNSREDRRQALDEATRERLDKKYSKARKILWGAVHPVDVETILGRVNPGLLPELYKLHPRLANPWTEK